MTPSELAKKREEEFKRDFGHSEDCIDLMFENSLESCVCGYEERKSFLQESSALLLENVMSIAEGHKRTVSKVVFSDIRQASPEDRDNHFYNLALTDLSLKLREEAKIIRGDK